jgi:hypothetical protein
MISSSEHESNTAREICRGAISASDYFKQVAEQLKDAPSHRVYWWWMRCWLRLAAWAADGVIAIAFTHPGEQR